MMNAIGRIGEYTGSLIGKVVIGFAYGVGFGMGVKVASLIMSSLLVYTLQEVQMFKKGDLVYHKSDFGVNKKYIGVVKGTSENMKGDLTVRVEWSIPKRDNPDNKFTHTYPAKYVVHVNTLGKANPNWTFRKERQKTKEREEQDETTTSDSNTHYDPDSNPCVFEGF